MAAMTSFHTGKCCHLVSVYAANAAAYAVPYSNSVRFQFLIYQ